MAQAGYTPIQLYLSTTASAVPSAGNLANGELAINITDGKLFYKDNGGVVQVLATKGAGTIGGSNTQVQYNSSGALAGSANLTFDGTTLTAAGLAGPHNGTVGATTPNTGAFTTLAASGAVTLSGGTANGVPYLNGSKVLTTGSALTFDGTTFNVGGRIGFSAFSSEVDNFALYVSSATSATTLTSFSTNPIAFRVNNAEQMRLTSTGLGIGTSSPSAKLHVEGNVLCSAGNIFTPINSGIFFSGTPNVYTSGIYSVNTLDVAINTNGVERARIDSSGNLLVGTTSGSANRIVKNASGAQVLEVFNTSTTSGTRALEIGMNTNGDAAGTFIRCGDQGAYRFQVLGNGNAQNTNNSYGSISDAKRKENVTDATPKLEKLQQVRVVNYNLIGETQKQIGVIAQELEQIFPGMVDESPDRDKEGNDLGTTTKSVKYSVFVPMLIKAIQEQQALIQTLTARVAALESN